MRPSQVVEFAREKAEEAAEKTGEVISKGLMEGWGKAKGLGEDLKKKAFAPVQEDRREENVRKKGGVSKNQ